MPAVPKEQKGGLEGSEGVKGRETVRGLHRALQAMVRTLVFYFTHVKKPLEG